MARHGGAGWRMQVPKGLLAIVVLFLLFKR